jgi:hypothetical protein
MWSVSGYDWPALTETCRPPTGAHRLEGTGSASPLSPNPSTETAVGGGSSGHSTEQNRDEITTTNVYW